MGGIVCVLAAPVRTLGWLCRGRAALRAACCAGCRARGLPFVEGDANLAPFITRTHRAAACWAL
ncbi:MAG: hypothetical protein ACLRI7_01920 [Ruthenibacterium lactatiformans]